tara:strand:+ start:549 stop:1628 length:1080 start_codon:yes stop_codon:yes gene_type:complete
MKKTKKEKDSKQNINMLRGQTLTVVDILLFMARYVKVFFVIPIIFVSISFLYLLFFSSPSYQSTAQILSSTKTANNRLTGIASQLGVEIPITQNEPKWDYKNILMSRTLAKSLLYKTFDTEKYGKGQTLLYILNNGNNVLPENKNAKELIAINNINSNMLNVSENNKTNTLELRFNTFEPKLAKELLESLIGELDKHLKDFAKRSTSETKHFIEERILETQAELENKEEALKDFTMRNRRIENSPLLLLEKQRLMREVTVLTGVFTTLKQQYETTKIEELRDSDYIIVLDKPDLPFKAISPNLRIRLIFSLVYGLGIGLILALVLEFNRQIDNKEKAKLSEAKLFVVSFINKIKFSSRN